MAGPLGMYMEQQFSDSGVQETEGHGGLEKWNGWVEPCHCPSRLPGDMSRVVKQGGGSQKELGSGLKVSFVLGKIFSYTCRVKLQRPVREGPEGWKLNYSQTTQCREWSKLSRARVEILRRDPKRVLFGINYPGIKVGLGPPWQNCNTSLGRITL